MEEIKTRLTNILADENLLELALEVKKLALDIDKHIDESEKNQSLQDNDEYQDMIDTFQDELLSMILELLGNEKQS
jgi:hypothetical protein